jgi:adenine-specific DNA-methyltransferase
MEKLKLKTPDLTEENILKISELFPNCVTEADDGKGNLKRSIDFDLLKQELSYAIVDGPIERYQLNWPGKREALLTANAPIAKTLRPCREESVDFDTTQNLFIEGDNLDALKLLQETYLGKVKMIYIDPPYNTGNDFIYEDDFTEDTDSYFVRSLQKDEEGNRMVANTESNGRFHSDWLSMMYPRLKLARNLLRDDGVIFLSIDDGEVQNLRKVCDEVFGSQNFQGHIHWRRRHNQPNDPTKMIGLVAEHILAFSKNNQALKEMGVGKVGLTGEFSNPDNDPRGEWSTKPWKAGSDQSGSKYRIQSPSGKIFEEEWLGDDNNFKALLNDGRIVFSDGGNGLPRKKYFRSEREQEGQCATNWWPSDKFGSNQEGNSILSGLMNNIKNTFSNPKPPRLLIALLSIANCKSQDIVLDFFAGSGTIFHAAFEYAHPLRIIAVQLPENLDSSIEAHLPAIQFCNIINKPLVLSEITKERIRRVGLVIKQSNELFTRDLDVGFRVLKVDTTNMKDVYYNPDSLEQDGLFHYVDNIKEDRSEEDLLFQVLLDWGTGLTLPIQKDKIQGKNVFFVDQNALVACFASNGEITEDFCKELAGRKPLRVVFRDSGFKDDSVKINVEQIFKLLSPKTEVRSI